LFTAFFITNKSKYQMELVINNVTYTLREMNGKRRHSFVRDVLTNYNFQSENFSDFLIETQKKLKENHGLQMTVEQVQKSFFKEFDSKIMGSIWEFLNAEDKKEIGTIDKLEVDKEQIKKFIEFNCAKIKEYTEYTKGNSQLF